MAQEMRDAHPFPRTLRGTGTLLGIVTLRGTGRAVESPMPQGGTTPVENDHWS
jgi:hypothetical protein